LAFRRWQFDGWGCSLAWSEGMLVHLLDVLECVEIRVPVTREIITYLQKFRIFCQKMGQGVVAKILSPMGFWHPCIVHSKFRPLPLRMLQKWGQIFGNWYAPGNQGGGEIIGVALKLQGCQLGVVFLDIKGSPSSNADTMHNGIEAA